MKQAEINRSVHQAVRVLRAGGVVAFPTETYYGLAVDPMNQRAVERLYQVKARPRNKPLLVLIHDTSQLSRLAASVPPCYTDLMRKFWPGPLTLVFPARDELSPLVTGGLGTIGVRRSSHPTAMALVEAFGGPVTATSANRSGGRPALSDSEVRSTFGPDVDFVIKGALPPCATGSTLVGYREGRVYCIREGRIPFREIISICPSSHR